MDWRMNYQLAKTLLRNWGIGGGPQSNQKMGKNWICVKKKNQNVMCAFFSSNASLSLMVLKFEKEFRILFSMFMWQMCNNVST